MDEQVERSSEATVVLRDVELGTSGTYRCEVITEAPVFHTKFGEGNMTVIDLPESAPVLDGAKTSYQLGEQVTVNCTSLYSKPAATLEWFINDELVLQSHYLKRYPPKREPDGLETAVLGLSFVTSRSHFPHGEMRLKCVAKIATVYFQSQETSVIETGFLPQTQAEERRHYFFSSGARVGGEHTLPADAAAAATCGGRGRTRSTPPLDYSCSCSCHLPAAIAASTPKYKAQKKTCWPGFGGTF
ncbi:hypothetical protein O3P69_001804 [Scylla paramamosain]|uniref:Ig-like domain-containing protein n=1 Tax=Scylla paramamosain TaxID=85552 RepID=A0AAW0UZN5_SCYPA